MEKPPLTGGLLIDKPAGPTSHDVVAQVRRILDCRAVGHAGTLDPFATGLLMVLVGRATRLARFVERLPKTYCTTVVLGRTTDTDDGTGTVIAEHAPAAWPDEATLRAVLASFVGTRPQRPPAYSARRVDGARAYKVARAGGVPELVAHLVTVHSLELLSWEAPRVTFRTVVSAGTYIRAIARDLGEKLGTGGHCSVLRRERVGPFAVEDAVPVDRLTRSVTLLDGLALLPGLRRVALEPEALTAVRHGRPVMAVEPGGKEAALVADGRLIAVAERQDGWWQPRVVLEAS